MVVYPKNFTAKAFAFGKVVTLTWDLPRQLPEDYTIVLFKGEGVDIPEDAISEYILNGTALPAGTGAIELPGGNVRYTDYDVSEGVVWYYRLTIRDNATSPPDFSNPYDAEHGPIAASTTVDPVTVTARFPDPKSLVAESLKIAQSTRSGVAEHDVFTGSTLFTHQLTDDLSLPAISVVGSNNYFDAGNVEHAQLKAFDIYSFNSVFAEFMGNRIDGRTELVAGDPKTIEGLIEQDAILVVWRTDSSESRDSVTRTMRSARSEILAWLKENDVMEARTAMGSDFEEQVPVGGSVTSVYGGSLVVQCRFESEFTFRSDRYVGDPVDESNFGKPPFNTQLRRRTVVVKDDGTRTEIG